VFFSLHWVLASTFLLGNSAPPRDTYLFVQPSSASPAAPHSECRQPVYSLPFALDESRIVLPVHVNGSGVLRFILDTGADHNLVNRTTAPGVGIPLQRGQAQAGVGTGDQSVALFQTSGVTLALGDLPLPFHSVVVLSLDSLAVRTGSPIDGAIGSDLFERYVVVIDYPHRMLTLCTTDNHAVSGGGVTLPLAINGHRPFVRAKVRSASAAETDGRFVVDLGANDGLSFHSPFLARHQDLIPERTIPHTSFGVAGPSPGRLGRIAYLTLGPVQVPNLLAVFSAASRGSAADESYDGAIGGGLLRRFIVTFDYQHRRMILDSVPPGDADDVSDMTGMGLRCTALPCRAIAVDQVVPGSPADSAGIHVTDLIEAVDDSLPPTLPQLREWFRQLGHAFRLRLCRMDGTVLRVVVVSRRLI
jgi:Aspartyl protease